MRGELPDIAGRRCVRSGERSTWSHIAAAISDCDLQAVVMFAAIGFLATINAVLYFPDFGDLFAQLAVFP
jgi:hypothetical protein